MLILGRRHYYRAKGNSVFDAKVLDDVRAFEKKLTSVTYRNFLLKISNPAEKTRLIWPINDI